jgi:hypothetical protein
MQGAQRSMAALAILLAGAGCEHQDYGITMDPPPQPLRAASPGAHFQLDAAERARLVPGYDAAALERLLARVTPDRRTEILRYFQFPKDRSVSLGLLVQIKDPELQPLLEEVWAPMWDHVGATDEQLAENAFNYPGRELAMQRRAARKQGADRQ